MSSPAPRQICGHCGEENAADRQNCWMCTEPLVDHEASEVIFPPGQTGAFFGWPTTVLTLGWLILFAVLLSRSPGLAIVLMIVTTPPLVRMMMLARKRAALGRDTSLGQTLQMSAMSLGATLMMCCLGVISAFGAFFSVCLGLLAAGSAVGLDQSPSPWWIIVVMAISAVSAILSVVAVVRAFRNHLSNRWNRDLDQE